MTHATPDATPSPAAPARRPIAADATPEQLISRHAADILASPGMRIEAACIQHGDTSVLAHSTAVSAWCVVIARALRVPVDERALVRGSLLHDYFLYDWHDPSVPGRRIHGFTHPGKAMRNAVRDFDISEKEQDIIAKHMFPLTIVPPRHRESFIVCVADKWCAICETFKIDVSDYLIERVNAEIEMSLALEGDILAMPKEEVIPANA